MPLVNLSINVVHKSTPTAPLRSTQGATLMLQSLIMSYNVNTPTVMTFWLICSSVLVGYPPVLVGYPPVSLRAILFQGHLLRYGPFLLLYQIYN